MQEPFDRELGVGGKTLGSATLSAAPESITPLIPIQPVCSKLFNTLVHELLVAKSLISVLSNAEVIERIFAAITVLFHQHVLYTSGIRNSLDV